MPHLLNMMPKWAVSVRKGPSRKRNPGRKVQMVLVEEESREVGHYYLKSAVCLLGELS